jgi:hypothetical protein
MFNWSACCMGSDRTTTSGGTRTCTVHGRVALITKVCVAPATKYSNVLPGVTPRQQWNINGGFCGAVSFQALHLAYGAWISQDLVRKANTHGSGHCAPGEVSWYESERTHARVHTHTHTHTRTHTHTHTHNRDVKWGPTTLARRPGTLSWTTISGITIRPSHSLQGPYCAVPCNHAARTAKQAQKPLEVTVGQESLANLHYHWHELAVAVLELNYPLVTLRCTTFFFFFLLR